MGSLFIQHKIEEATVYIFIRRFSGFAVSFSGHKPQGVRYRVVMKTTVDSLDRVCIYEQHSAGFGEGFGLIEF